MRKMQTNLQSLLTVIGRKITKNQLPRLTHAAVFRSDYVASVEQVYRSLGGVLDRDSLAIRIYPWDIEASGIAVELDEEQHFNRYRQRALESDVYSQLPAFPAAQYKAMCNSYENCCLKKANNRGYWTYPNCEKQFGPAGAKGDLTGSGAPRWKQRAFYDFVKDLTYPIIAVRSVRISIWDSVEIGDRKYLVRDVLSKGNSDAAKPIWSLIESRL